MNSTDQTIVESFTASIKTTHPHSRNLWNKK